MTRLTIRLLGSFQVNIDATPISQFESNKVRALLAYLVVEQQQVHRREKLAELFWPEMSVKRANSNLSQAIYNLRNLIQDDQTEPPYLLRTRSAVQFNPDSDYWLDVHTFATQIVSCCAQVPEIKPASEPHFENIQFAVKLYRDAFLTGLTFDSSLAFDAWVLVWRQRLQRQMITGLEYLAEYHSARGEIV